MDSSECQSARKWEEELECMEKIIAWLEEGKDRSRMERVPGYPLTQLTPGTINIQSTAIFSHENQKIACIAVQTCLLLLEPFLDWHIRRRM